MSILQNSNAISAGGYDINNSLRFRQSATAYLSRTFTTPTNNKIGTISLWRKRGSPGTYDTIYGTVSTTTGNGPYIQFNTDNLRFVDNSSDLVSSQVFRDYSAWYHIVVAIDTTQATASNRVKIYVNGSQITAFSSSTYGALNYNSDILSSGSQYIGYSQPSNARGAEGYLAEVNFIDGQALTPSSFGETDTTTGVWKPKAYSGTYGTNGFYLKFSDIATTSGSNAGLGKDFSGNSNYWTTNNISVTSGTTYDAMTDSPTLTSATVANYAILNPIGSVKSVSNLSQGNLLSSSTSTTIAEGAVGTISMSSGKWYWEVTVTTTPYSKYPYIGIIPDTTWVTNSSGNVTTSNYSYNADGNKVTLGTFSAYGASFTTNDVIGVAFDASAGTLTFYKNNVSQGTAFTGLSGSFLPYLSVFNTGGTGAAAINFGQRPFTYTPPTGFKALNTYNLPDSTIKKGNSYMDVTTYTGTGATRSLTGFNFQPDFTWFKTRNVANSNVLFDSIRGVGKELFSDLTNAEVTRADSLTAFNSNGVTLGADSGQGVNANTQTQVGWFWNAGSGTTSSNTSGSITSTVSVNTTAGFSVVTYTGTGANATVGHGLGVAPKMIIVKNRSNGAAGDGAWQVYHTSIGAANYLVLNTTAASAAGSTRWQSTTPTSSVFYIGATGSVNNTSENYVAYCWAEIAGFSKFGSFTSNASADGTFVYLGFRPKYIMFKPSSYAGEQWYIQDSSRSPSNVATAGLYANLSIAEDVGTAVDLLSNGFKLRVANGINANSGATVIYAAFAENPFKNANAR